MNNNPEGAKLAKETLTGDIAAFLIDRLRQFPKPYQQMSEKEQKEQIEMAKEAARNLVSNAVNIVASAGRKTVKAKLIKYSVKDGCKVELDGAKSIAGELADVVGDGRDAAAGDVMIRWLAFKILHLQLWRLKRKVLRAKR